MKKTLEDALQGFASAYKAVAKYKKTAADKLKKLNGTLTEKVKEVFDAGGKAKDAKAVLEAEEIEFNSETIDTYFSALTPADKKQNKGGNKNPAIAKADKALNDARGEKLVATSANNAVEIGLKYTEPFFAKSINDNGKTIAPANASDLQKLQANVQFADAINKGALATARAAANLLKIAQAAVGLQVRMDAKTVADAKADKATAKVATGRRNRKPAKAKAKAKATA